MRKIRILPEILSNQIAAGEVVQRPVSVVKELVENSMDAGADRITVEIENGGKSLIRVSDNGAGLDRDQAMLAIERYATSKIYEKEDLFSISSFGFRGEALPSIASVSRFTLVSRPKDLDAGTRIDINGGRLAKVADTGAPPGTMVEVRQLFFNTPVRRKFLKAQSTENSHVSDAVSGLALGNPDIGFRLFLNKKLVKNFPPSQDLITRAGMVLGRDAAGHLYPLDGREDQIRISGVCANPQVTRSTANRIYLFVNNRLVHDRGIVAAIFRGFRGRIMKGRFPLAVVCVSLPYDQVDVNVHPSKREIKFLNPQPVYDTLARTVSCALSDAQTDPLAYSASASFAPTFLQKKYQQEGQQGYQKENQPEEKENCFSTSTDPGSKSNPGREAQFPESVGKPSFSVAQDKMGWDQAPGQQAPGQKEATQKETGQNSAYPGEMTASERPPVLGNKEVESYHGTPFREMGPSPAKPQVPCDALISPGRDEFKVLGQVLNTYIVVEKENHLVLVDQHAAHERIVYEALKKRHKTIRVQSQTLMVPEIIDLTHKEADILDHALETFAGLGLEIARFGGESFVIKAVPVLVEEKAVKEMVLEMVEQISAAKGGGGEENWLDHCLVTMACHRAVRANQAMNPAEMKTLIADLMDCENPMHCPHGRPILVSFDQRQLEKLFKRLV